MKTNPAKSDGQTALTPSRADGAKRRARFKSPVLFALSLVALVWVTGSIGQPGPPPSGLVGLWPGYLRGNVTSVATDGRYAYVGMTLRGPGGCSRGWRGRLEVIDLRDPIRPLWVSALDLREPVQRVQVTNNLVYLASGRSLSVLTVTNPAAPLPVGQCEAEGDIKWFQVRDQFLYAVRDSSLDVFDVSNTPQPVRVGSTNAFGAGFGVQVANDCAYVAAGNGLHIIDVSVPDQPALMATTLNSNTVHAVDIAGSYAYLATDQGLKVVNIANPLQPLLVGTNWAGAGDRILVAGSHCYVIDGSGLEVLDVSDASQPRSIGGYNTGAPVPDFALLDHYALLAAGAEGLQILDLSNPANPAFVAIGTRETGGPAEAIQVVGRYAYLADGDSGLQVIDLANSNGLVRVGRCRTTNYARAVHVVGTNAYVGTDIGLEIVDVSNPETPARVSGLDIAPEGYLGYEVEHLQVVSNIAYMPANFLIMVDVSDPARPTQITNCDAVASAGAVQVVGQFAYVGGYYYADTNSGYGLVVIDVSDPAQPRFRGACSTVAPIQDLRIVGDRAYAVASRNQGFEDSDVPHPQSWLQVIDIANPAEPLPLGQCVVSEDAHALQVVGRYAYIAGGSWREDAPGWRDGLTVVDVSDPANPTRVCSFSTPGWAAGIQVVGDQVYLADGPAGLAVLSLPALPTGPLTAEVEVSWTNVVVGYELSLTGWIDGWASASVWDFGDGTTLSNRLDVNHAWAAPGDYTVELRTYNESNPDGVSATVTVHVGAQPVYYVAADNATPVPPYTSWATAATNIQDAVDAADAASFPPGSLLVLVTNGVYSSGGRAVTGIMTNRVAVDKPLTLRSVNGPEFTVIRGYQLPGTTNGDGAIRCVYLGGGASMSGFTLTKGATRALDEVNTPEVEMSGGGLWGESSAWVSNCVILGNSASRKGGGACGPEVYGSEARRLILLHCTLATNYSVFGGGVFSARLEQCELAGNVGMEGGGAYLSVLSHCRLTGNVVGGPWYGSGGGAAESTLDTCLVVGNHATRYGGAYYAGGGVEVTLNNCTIANNSAGVGNGGVLNGNLNNCILYANTAPANANFDGSSTLNFCCTTPLPTNGVHNITSAPLFVDYAGGNLRLQSNSPCINAGLNTFAPGSTDLDGNPRIVSGTADIGAYEFQSPGSVISYAWLQQFGLPTDGSADATDADADGHTTWEEWRCLTDPTNALSALRLLSASPGGSDVTVSWQSVAGVNYFLERSTNLAAAPCFTLLATGIPGQPGATSFTDTNAASPSPLFYRVGLQE